ncbi:ribonuclease HI [Oikeobacillus pervagus]|uniref:Ribonuclease HI n=1 Tax=Oikeobacillus pervagus TaxID=1325931 RepID=A0AAJ1SVI0_9BACI|nr:RNase H family protein [Oikeobacillus pervagus]MDQ0213625.1 ribonuclease HI [Oikeobacillus pervagus]
MYEVYTDGASTGSPGLSGAGIFIKHQGQVERYTIPLGLCDPHEAEFLALLKALEILIEKKAETVSVRSDSQVVVNAVEKEYIHNPNYQPILHSILSHVKQIPLFFIKWIPSKTNHADILAKRAIKLNKETEK